MDNYKLISIIIQILLLIGGFYLVFFKSYFTEKGKNIATKEDIAEITTKVEGIKTDFIRETEHLKHNLQFENQIRIMLSTDTKNAIVSAYESFYIWLETSYDAFLSSIEFEKIEQIRTAESNINMESSKFSSTLARFELYIDREDSNSLISELETKTTKFQSLIENYLLKLEFLFEEIEDLEKENEDDNLDDNLFEENENKIDKLQDDMDELYKSTNAVLVNEYKYILDLKYKFRAFCFNMLTGSIK